MTIATLAKNNFLDGQDFDEVSLHSAFPGSTGANELTGGSYARQAYVINLGSGGSRVSSGSVTFDVPVSTVAWIGYWNLGSFLFALPNGGATPKNFSVAPDTDIVWSTSHGWLADQKLVFYQGTPPAPLVEGTKYYVVNPTTHGFQVAATLGGAVINLTDGASAGCWMASMNDVAYGVPDTHTLSASNVVLPD